MIEFSQNKNAVEDTTGEPVYSLGGTETPELNRRAMLGLTAAAVAAPFLTAFPDTAEAAKKQKQAPTQAPAAPVTPIEKGDTQKELAVIEEMKAYTRMLKENPVFATGSAGEIVEALTIDPVTKMRRPFIPISQTVTPQNRNIFYPPFSTEYTGATNPTSFPVIRFVAFDSQKAPNFEAAKQAGLLEVTNAGRFGENQLLFPIQFVSNVKGSAMTKHVAPGLNIMRWDMPGLVGEHKSTQITRLTALKDDQISEGAYVVGVGRYSPRRGDEIFNGHEVSGANYLTGFLKNPRKPENKALRESYIELARQNLKDPVQLDRFMKVLDKSFIMLAESEEWVGLGDRIEKGVDNVGQLVYIKNGSNWESMGVVHFMGRFEAPGNANADKTSQKRKVLIYLVHGPDAVREALGQK